MNTTCWVFNNLDVLGFTINKLYLFTLDIMCRHLVWICFHGLQRQAKQQEKLRRVALRNLSDPLSQPSD